MHRGHAVVLSLLPFSVAFLLAVRLAAAPPIQRFIANAVDLDPLAPGAMTRAATDLVEIGIERWSTDAERDQLMRALESGDHAAVVKVLEKMPRIGHVRHLGSDFQYPLEYACESSADGGERRLILATEAPYNSLRVIEIRFGKDGVGEGRIAKGVGIASSKDHTTIELTAYKQAQVCLKDVRKR